MHTYIYIYIYIYTTFLGPPKAGHTNEMKTLIKINYYFRKLWILEKVGDLKIEFNVVGELCIIDCYFECSYEIQCQFKYI